MTTQETIRLLKMEMLGDSEQMECAKQIAVEALEKQIPKKPIINKRKIQCVNGHNQPVQHYKYCPMCGQLMDWSDEV